MELASKYNPADVEGKWYQYWLDHKLFSSKPDGREPYTIVIPPPNVTGVLHMGHMLNNTIQDILVRRARMEGKNACWVPGTDHASIATEAKVVNKLAAQGIKKTDLTRDEFLKHAWEWTDEHGGIILKQLRKLGASCDWDRTAFTMDEKRSESVLKVFVDLYNKGLIYRGVRMVNWDPKALTALSDEEVIYKEEHSKLYYLKYYVADDDMSGETGAEGEVVHRDASGRRYAVVATTRPETIMGDTAMCINPADPKNQWLKGKKVIVPLVNRVIPVIQDDYVDVEFGTGCLKVTPAHDVNDYMLGEKYNLPAIDIFNDNGTLSEAAGLYVGMDRFDVREQIEKDLQHAGLLEKVEAYTNKVGFSERTNVAIEPKLSMQWFLKMQHFADMALPPVMNDDLKFYPAKYKNTYKNWLENIKDWCISRQLWWGHRIPAYFLPEGGYVVAATPEEALKLAQEKTGNPALKAEDLRQDEDCLDTWFSSWLWPISLFDGILNPGNEEINYYYPTSDLVTGPDIIFFWVARMIMAGYRFQHNKPFSNVFFTSIIRDKIGRKMSKSLGNSPDPLDLIANYGADGLRFGLMRIAPTGTDVRFDENQISEGRNFANKLYNATRFRLMQGDARGGTAPHYSSVHISIISRLKQLHADVEKALADYEFNALIQTLYQFFWNEYCDRFLEAVKGDLKDGADPAARAATLTTMDTVLRHYLALLHPVMPHITEELWASLGFAEGNGGLPLMRTPIPSAENLLAGLDESRITLANTQAAALYETANKARNLKAEYDLSNNKNVSFILKTPHDVPQDLLSRLAILANAKSVIRDAAYSSPKGTPVALTPLGELFLPLEGLIDVEAEKERLGRELDKIAREIAKSAAKLGNAGFVERAPAEVVNQEKARLADWEAKQSQLKGMLDSLS